MKIVSHYLESIEGVAIYPIIGILIFVLFFIVLLFYLFYLDKGYVKDMGNLPLDDDLEVNENQTKKL
ncbi:MAG: hypothetical protein K9H64_22135 [Bacteroidales bacterium]|nr:hypothetical protein [Bacteroidales bacterium]MCF8458751.1 hypothetical protein [Bacteroidales bacterium]